MASTAASCSGKLSQSQRQRADQATQGSQKSALLPDAPRESKQKKSLRENSYTVAEHTVHIANSSVITLSDNMQISSILSLRRTVASHLSTNCFWGLSLSKSLKHASSEKCMRRVNATQNDPDLTSCCKHFKVLLVLSGWRQLLRIWFALNNLERG